MDAHMILVLRVWIIVSNNEKKVHRKLLNRSEEI